jgi:hypothetical protein
MWASGYRVALDPDAGQHIVLLAHSDDSYPPVGELPSFPLGAPWQVHVAGPQALALPIMMADSESDHEDMPPLLTDSDDNEELPALLPNAAARQRPQAPGPCQYRHSLAGGFAKPGRQG